MRGDFLNSLDAFKTCLKKRGDWPEAQLNAGIAYWKTGDLVGARGAFQDVLASRPGNIDALRGLAALTLEAGDHTQSLHLHQRLIDAGQRSPEIFYNAGLICQELDEIRDAIVFYREALKIDPDFPEALLNLGHALNYIGAKDEARACWRKAISIRPDRGSGCPGP